MTTSQQQALDLFESHTVLRTRDALDLGIHPRTLYALRDKGLIESLGRGLYARTDREPLTEPDLVIVTQKVEPAIVGFISAAAFHRLTTQIPHAVHIALPAFWHEPALDYPPLEVYRVSEPAYSAGVERHHLAGVDVPIYTPEKTVADLFKFRRRVGRDVALEVLKQYLVQAERNVDALVEHAEICRVAKVMQPYVEAWL